MTLFVIVFFTSLFHLVLFYKFYFSFAEVFYFPFALREFIIAEAFL